MLKLMIGVKGTGKTKTLIEKVNAAAAASHGDVVCIEKGTGLRFLAERLGIKMNQTMACGDSENDLYMLKEAYHAVAMGNATGQIKEICNFITLSNEESGVAYAIEKLVFGE